MAGKEKPFTDVDFPRQYPQQDVAEHEVLMAFRDDCDAIQFQRWWNEKGAVAFNKWLGRRDPKRSKTLCEVLADEE